MAAVDGADSVLSSPVDSRHSDEAADTTCRLRSVNSDRASIDTML